MVFEDGVVSFTSETSLRRLSNVKAPGTVALKSIDELVED